MPNLRVMVLSFMFLEMQGRPTMLMNYKRNKGSTKPSAASQLEECTSFELTSREKMEEMLETLANKPSTSSTAKPGLDELRKKLKGKNCCFEPNDNKKKSCFAKNLEYKDARLSFVDLENWTNGPNSYDIRQDQSGVIYGECLREKPWVEPTNCKKPDMYIFSFIKRVIESLKDAPVKLSVEPEVIEMKQKLKRKRCCFRGSENGKRECFAKFLDKPDIQLRFVSVDKWTNGQTPYDLKLEKGALYAYCPSATSI